MKYQSTRGGEEPKSFSQVILKGLAEDGGLYIPETLPDFTDELDALKELSYLELCVKILAPFVAGSLTEAELFEVVAKSLVRFRHSKVAPLLHLKQHSILELFHGPTYAFKDFALQLLGNLLEKLLAPQQKKLNLLVATSGDTGSATIQGVLGKKHLSAIVLYPYGLVSPVQELQMISETAPNVHCIAINGTFDDCQRMVKNLLDDSAFCKRWSLGAANSINWGRIIAQTVYYFYASFEFHKKFPDKPLWFSVPSGNFGNVYAGYVAKKMGLDIQKLVVATNENNIVAQAIQTGVYKTNVVKQTIAPSMDIQVASNFERLLADVCPQAVVRSKIQELKQHGQFTIEDEFLEKIQQSFLGVFSTEQQAKRCIQHLFDAENTLLDPHTTFGLVAAKKLPTQPRVVCLATAHPAKFQPSLEAILKTKIPMPKELLALAKKPTRFTRLEAKTGSVRHFIEKNLDN